jgi:hypothetical protein
MHVYRYLGQNNSTVYESYESIHSKIDSTLQKTGKSDTSNGQYNKESTGKIDSYTDHIDGKSDDTNVGTPNMPKNSDIPPAFDKNQEIGCYLEATAHLSHFIQLNHDGFMPNQRQHRQFGLSVLQMSESSMEHIVLLHSEQEGLAVSDKSSSCAPYHGWRAFSTNDIAHKGFHIFSWRDLFDTAVRWRQMSEPMDVVYWLDRCLFLFFSLYTQIDIHIHIFFSLLSFLIYIRYMYIYIFINTCEFIFGQDESPRGRP